MRQIKRIIIYHLSMLIKPGGGSTPQGDLVTSKSSPSGKQSCSNPHPSPAPWLNIDRCISTNWWSTPKGNTFIGSISLFIILIHLVFISKYRKFNKICSLSQGIKQQYVQSWPPIHHVFSYEYGLVKPTYTSINLNTIYIGLKVYELTWFLNWPPIGIGNKSSCSLNIYTHTYLSK